jgi:hypothetical protein
MRRNAGVPALAKLLKETRLAQGLSRAAVADRAAHFTPDGDYEPRYVEELETRIQTVPAPEVLVPTCRALGLQRDVVLDVLLFSW